MSQGIGQVSSGAKELSNGAKQLDDSVEKQVIPGVSALANGTERLDQGANSLLEGVNKLHDGTGSLVNGTQELVNGTIELNNGMKKFNTEGIKKLSNKVNGDLKKVTNRIKELQRLGDEYNSFASDEEREAIKFITIIDSMKNTAKDETNEEIILNTENNTLDNNVVEDEKDRKK